MRSTLKKAISRRISVYFCFSSANLLLTYLTVIENLVHGFGDKEDLSTVTPDHKQETISSLNKTAQKSQASAC